MKVLAQTPSGCVYIDILDIPQPDTDIQTLLKDVAKIKMKLGIV